jgi:hypothetical protein
MRHTRKIIYVLLGLFVLALLSNWGLNIWIDKQLPQLIAEKNKTPYTIKYKKADVSIWNSNVKVSGITITLKKNFTDTLTAPKIYATIVSVEIQKFRIWSLLFGDKIRARNIIIHKPVVLLYKKNKKAPKEDKVKKPFGKIVEVSKIQIQQGRLRIINDSNNIPVLTTKNINIDVNDIVITDATLKQKIPFLYKAYALRCDSLYYKINDFYHITSGKVKVTHTDVKVTAFALVPEYTRPEFVQRIKKETDLFMLKSDSIRLKHMNWGFKNDRLFFEAQAIEIDQMFANIYRNKIPKDDLSKKHLYNKLLRDLSFRLKVDTLKIRNSLLKYEEEINFRKGPGILTFNKFHLTATNIRSGFGVKKLPDLKILVNCRFMNTSPMKVNWKLNVMDPSDGFVISGSIFNFNTQRIDRFTKPHVNAKTHGVLDKVYFNFIGNDKVSKGNFALQYRDFKVAIYQKKDRQKKDVVLSFLGNLLVKNDSDQTVKEVTVAVDRIPEKSFYNLLWRSIAEGLKKILI